MYLETEKFDVSSFCDEVYVGLFRLSEAAGGNDTKRLEEIILFLLIAILLDINKKNV